MRVRDFAEMEKEFTERVNSMVWCSFATIDRKNRPYSRIMHPLWEGKTGWVLTHRDSHKGKHLDHNPHVSLAYIRGDIQRPVYVDCVASWCEDAAERSRVWALAESIPPPLGFDPAADFESPDNPRFGLLKLDPWRIVLVTFPAPSHEAGNAVWRNEPRDAPE